jgi:DNA-binding NarL/FixJ family response regulator
MNSVPPQIRTALVVSPSPDLRQRIVAELAASPAIHGVLEAGAGLMGLGLLLRHHPETVLLDVGVEDVNGFHLLLRMRQLQPECAVILLCDSPDPFVREIGMRFGAADLLQKTEEPAYIVGRALLAARGTRMPLAGADDRSHEK